MKRVSLKMKTALRKAAYGIIALACVVTMVACENASAGSEDKNSNTNQESTNNGNVNAEGETADDNSASDSNGSVTYGPSSIDLSKVGNRSGDKALAPLSKEEIKTLLAETDPAKTWPQGNYGQDVTTLPADAIKAGLDRVNAIRKLMGVHPVKENKEYTRKAQLGARMLAKKGSGLHHGGVKVEGFSSKELEDGNEALSHGNLSSYNLVVSADNWLQDPGQPGNPMHRVWMTAPVAGHFGFGYVEANRSRAAAEMTGYSVLRACDQSWNPKYDWDFVAWPAPGYTPLGLWPESHIENDSGPNTIWTSPWSIYFSAMGDCTITLTRKNDGKVWVASYTADTTISGQQSALKGSAGYKNLMTGERYPISASANNGPGATGVTVLSFYPNEKDHVYKDGDVYNVTIKYGGTGSLAQTYSYDVEFFDPTK